MSKTTKVLLVLSLSCLTAGLLFVTGTLNVGEATWPFVTFPAGAILFGLFLISLSLQGATALFDQEQRAIAAAISSATSLVRKPCCEAKNESKEALVSAHAH
jgi:hypothetical protein